MAKRPSPAYLRERLLLDESAGTLTWKTRPVEAFKAKTAARQLGICLGWNRLNAGKPAFFSPSHDGDLSGRLDNVHYQTHHIIFAMVHDRWPTDYVRHHDNNLTNNRPNNLYEDTPMAMNRNRIMGSPPANKLSAKGVKQRGEKFTAECGTGKTYRYLGTYPTKEQAAEAYQNAIRLPETLRISETI